MTNIPKGPLFVTKDYGDGRIEIQEASALSTALVAGSPQSVFYISAVPPYKNIAAPALNADRAAESERVERLVGAMRKYLYFPCSAYRAELKALLTEYDKGEKG